MVAFVLLGLVPDPASAQTSALREQLGGTAAGRDAGSGAPAFEALLALLDSDFEAVEFNWLQGVDDDLLAFIELVLSPTRLRDLDPAERPWVLDRVRDAADQGVELAQFAMGEWTLWGGSGVEGLDSALGYYDVLTKSDREPWVRLGSARGGQIALGLFGGKPQLERAEDFYRRGVETGDKRLTRQLGLLYLQGFEDLARAAALLDEAAKAGDAIAQFHMGRIVAGGLDGRRAGPDSAAKMFVQAARQGHDQAGFALYRSAAEGRRPLPDDEDVELMGCRPVFFVTNRTPLMVSSGEQRDFGQDDAGGPSYGFVDVMIRLRDGPDDHGFLEDVLENVGRFMERIWGSSTERFFAGPSHDIPDPDQFWEHLTAWNVLRP